jgi:L-lactate dehydrogenase complex protein LldG
VHLVWLERGRLHDELGSALEAARAEGPLPAALALHSGPSKSADIGRIVVTGVHGPGRLVVAVTEFELAEL